LQQIQQQLTGAGNPSRQMGTAKVAVVMPSHSRFMPPVEEIADVPVAAIAQKAPAPRVAETAPLPEAAKPRQEEPAKPIKNEKSWFADPLREIPTLSQQASAKELNDTIGQNGTSLNDTLKTEKTELAAVLTDMPIRDLKKGIGINDRYVFLSELFRGDDAMYERSIKTINGFRILAEAEYWIERELKVKLGWDDGKATTQHFYQLVKRRFS
ncbi:MAG TPA: hypothetical protein VL307_13885, partial [Chitinophagaceae bacterium]|nr:hypothetical protein [Chitinophagaceae bacterium]